MDAWPGNRVNIVRYFDDYGGLTWSLNTINSSDINKFFVISSDDWLQDGLCIPDFRLTTAINNFKQSPKKTEKHKNISDKQDIFKSDSDKLDTKLILVAPSRQGPFTIIEGNKRSVALGSLDRLNGLKIYLGVSPHIESYIWARYSRP